MNSPRFHVLINSQSGTAKTLGREKIEKLVKDSAFDFESFDFLEPEAFSSRLTELLDSPAPVLIGGGDGTIAKSAALHLKKDKPFAILPFGTMNMFAQDLQIPVAFPDSLNAHRDTKTVSVDVGFVNGKNPFLCCAGWGTMPEAAIVREDLRDAAPALMVPRLTRFIVGQMDRTQKRSIRLGMDGRKMPLHTAMLVVSNNLYDPASVDTPFKKETLDQGVFGVYSIAPTGIFAKIRFFLRLTHSGWEADPSIDKYEAKKVTLETGRTKELISIDGEPVELEGPFHFTLKPRALKVIVPANPAAVKAG